MTTLVQSAGAAEPTQFVILQDRKLAFRSIGEGVPILLCVRFRGTMDSWDPAFLDSLAANGFRVIVFDYSGLGQSTGESSYDPRSLARDAIGLLDALGIEKAVIGGWSIGGIAAQIVLATAPARVRHLALIATVPPGPLARPGEQLFFELAKRDNDFEDVVTIFFEPASPASREAAKRSEARFAARSGDRSPDVPVDWAAAQLGDRPRNPVFPAEAVLHALKATNIPVSHIGGDHDIALPVENWHALSGKLPTLHLLTLPSTGHAPHHQYPELCAAFLGFLAQAHGIGCVGMPAAAAKAAS
ncbi:alpha/beta fold hydrolase [Dongia sedimenti]|uniref:Alpha/beta hydrolase n=1 Tax=Dongia sedimenti TaxID=3064282 RepID=A0ABU0YTA4_9PROT|nr:alpha/beta hydrolase [Rhodospirillaceae bacterium R-7]